jgi:hypothetical protein
MHLQLFRRKTQFYRKLDRPGRAHRFGCLIGAIYGSPLTIATRGGFPAGSDGSR